MSFISKADLSKCIIVLCFKLAFNMWNTLENVACEQQKPKREKWKGDGGENVQEAKARMTSEWAAHPSASQSWQQHEYQSGAADRQVQMKKGEEEREQGLWGNDEAVKGNNCRCIFFFSKLKGDQPMQTWRWCFGAAFVRYLKTAWFLHRTLIFLQKLA